jgi:two-component system, NarL family, response regulator
MRVLLIEDDEAFRLGTETFLLRLPGVAEVITARDGEQGLALIASTAVEVVVLDIGLPGLGGLETCRRITASFSIPVLVLTSQEDTSWVRRLWEVGASGYLHKAEAFDQLEIALNSLSRGASWWDRSATQALRPGGTTASGTGHDDANALKNLTLRERDVLRAMAEGLTNQQIATLLGIGGGTVRVYIHTIFQKLQVTNRTQAVLKFLDQN